MSDLPKNVRVPHFRAHREVLKPRPGESGEDYFLRLSEWSKAKKPHRPPSPFRKGRSFEGSALKAEDLVAFNTKAEEFFVYWLAEAIRGTKGEGIPPSKVIQNAAFELDISLDTARRYLVKHTADRAEFHSDGKRVTLRKE